MTCFRTIALALTLGFGAVAAMPIVAEAAPKAQRKKAAKPARSQVAPQPPIAAQPALRDPASGRSY